MSNPACTIIDSSAKQVVLQFSKYCYDQAGYELFSIFQDKYSDKQQLDFFNFVIMTSEERHFNYTWQKYQITESLCNKIVWKAVKLGGDRVFPFCYIIITSENYIIEEQNHFAVR